MSVKHVDPPAGFVAGADTEIDVDRVTVRDWQADHPHPPFLIAHWVMLSGVWWAIPAARTELWGTVYRRGIYSFEHADRIRMVVGVRRPGGKGLLSLQYSSDNGATWGSLDGAGGPQVNCAKYGALDSGWKKLSQTIVGLGAASVLLRLVGEGGDGVISSKIDAVWVYVL